MPEVVDFITDYAGTISAPVHTRTMVTQVRAKNAGYQVTTNRGTWTCETIVLASGAANIANLPPAAALVPASIAQHTPVTYRTIDRLDDRGVLDRKRRLCHEGGVVTGAPGMYLLGTNLLRRRRSSFITGAKADTAELAHISTGTLTDFTLAPPTSRNRHSAAHTRNALA